MNKDHINQQSEFYFPAEIQYFVVQQKLMLNKFKEHKQIGHFMAYSASCAIYGMTICALGPLIPYLSDRSGIIQTQYSFLFSCRSFAMLGGAILLKFIQKNFEISHHKIIMGSSILIAISSVLFSWSDSLFLQGLWMVTGAIGYVQLQILVNVCILMTNPQEDRQFWMLLNLGAFGFGGLIGPIIIYIFEAEAFAVIGLLFVLTLPAYYLLAPPQYSNPELKDGNNVQTQQTTPRKIQVLLCLFLFLYIGIQCTFGGWISSYSILAGVSTKQNATAYPSIFWIFITLFRFILAFLPGTTSEKMKYLLYGTLATSLLSLLLINNGFTQLACYLSAVLYGVTMSSFYVQVFTISPQFGFNLAEFQTGNIVSCAVLGEGFLTMFVGVLMERIHINMLFWGIGIMTLLMEIIRRVCVKYFEEAKTKLDGKAIQLLEKIRSV